MARRGVPAVISPQEAAAMHTTRSPPILSQDKGKNSSLAIFDVKTRRVKPHRSLACPPRICVKQYPQKNPPRTSPESILLQWNSSDMDTTQMGMVILAPYSRQVPRNSISIHFLKRGLGGFKKKKPLLKNGCTDIYSWLLLFTQVSLKTGLGGVNA